MNEQDARIIREIETAREVLSSLKRPTLYGAAPFWEELSAKHCDLIRRHGFQKFKRTINFEYHQWKVRSLADAKILRLLGALIRRIRFPAGGFLCRFSARHVPEAQDLDAAGYAFFMGLLWQYARAVDGLGCLDVCGEPPLGDPLPVRYGGRLISQDLATSTIELNSIARWIDLNRIERIGEIGSGYGRFAYVTVSRFPNLSYSLFDIPPALVVAQNYLTGTLGAGVVEPFHANGSSPSSRRRVQAFLPHQLEQFPDGHFDLMINISSFDEMAAEQVENYMALIDRKCRGWLYVKGHSAAPSWCSISGGGITQLPYRASWKLRYEGKDAFSPTFRERIYSLRGA